MKTPRSLAAALICTCLCSCAVDRRPKPSTAPVAATAAAAGAAAKTPPFTLVGSEWQLEDFAGSTLVENAHPTLAFPEADKVTGNGSCNRFFGPVQVAGTQIKLGPLGSARMACPQPLMDQESKYLAALQAAVRFEWQDPYLLLYSNALDKPLRFMRAANSGAPH